MILVFGVWDCGLKLIAKYHIAFDSRFLLTRALLFCLAKPLSRKKLQNKLSKVRKENKVSI